MANFNITGTVNSITAKSSTKLGELTSGITNTIKSFSDPIQQLFGVRGQIYTIGYIPAAYLSDNPMVQNGLAGGLIKAYQNAANAIKQFSKDANPIGLPEQNGITIDGFFNFEGDMAVDLPKYPIQFQTNISMQRIRTPDTVKMNVFISSRYSDDVLEKASKIVTNNDLVSLFTGQDGDQARIRRKLNELRWLQNFGKPFKLYTPHAVYENMLLRRIMPRNDETTMDGWSGTLEFVESVYYTDVNDTTSRRNKKELSQAGSTLVTTVKDIFGFDFSF